MIQFIHVYLNITILYQGDAIQISNLVSQYNNSVANGEPMTCLLYTSGCLREQAAENRLKQLFSKNTGLCETEKMCIRDRSKGHTAPGLYAALAERGFFPKEDLVTLRHTGSYLQGHPDMKQDVYKRQG